MHYHAMTIVDINIKFTEKKSIFNLFYLNQIILKFCLTQQINILFSYLLLQENDVQRNDLEKCINY